MDAREALVRLAAWIDHHHPRLGRAVLSLRWGGLRSVRLPALGWGALLGSGAVAGTGARRGAGRVLPPRAVPGPILSAAGGAGLAWLALWRWDDRRWRRRHVAVVVDLPEDDLQDLARRLGELDLPVQRWERPAADRSARGLRCRVQDLRRLNGLLDELLGARPAGGVRALHLVPGEARPGPARGHREGERAASG